MNAVKRYNSDLLFGNLPNDINNELSRKIIFSKEPVSFDNCYPWVPEDYDWTSKKQELQLFEDKIGISRKYTKLPWDVKGETDGNDQY